MVFNRRTFIALGATSLAAVAGSATAAPPIAYTKEAGGKFELYLTNENGSGTVKLYSSPARNSIGNVDMNPAGNQIAFTESRSTGFKILQYSANGLPATVTTYDDGCWVDGLDYHPFDSSLLIIHRCPNPQSITIRRWANGAYLSSMLPTNGQNDAYRGVRWLGDGRDFLMVYATPTGATLRRHSLDFSSAPVPIKFWEGLGAGPRGFDAARCQDDILQPACMKIVYEDATGVRELIYDSGGAGADSLLVAGATGGRYSPNNGRILYRASAPKGTYTLNVTNPPETAGAKAVYGTSDWRP
jgi:hypothetical protein